jgi:hypothetical protein
MKSKGILLIGVACLMAVSLFLLRSAVSEEEEDNPAIYGITYVNGVATNDVLVEYEIEHGNDDDCTSFQYGVQAGNYLVGKSKDWGSWHIYASFTRNDTLYCKHRYGTRTQYNPNPDEVDLYLLFCDYNPQK